MQRIDVGDSQSVRYKAARSASPARPDTHSHLARFIDEILHDEKIRRIPHPFDDAKLKIYSLLNLRRNLCKTPGEALFREFIEIIFEVLNARIRRNREIRHVVLFEIQVETALVGDLER